MAIFTFCTTSASCSNNGVCLNGRCTCFDYFTGDTCHLTYAELLGSTWTIFLTFFVVLFVCVAAVALVQLIRSALIKVDLTYWKGLHLLVLAEGIFQMLDLGLAPGVNRSPAPLWVRRILAGLTVYFVEAIITTILIYWCKYYMRVFASDPHPKIRRVVRFYRVLLVFAFLFEMLMRFLYEELDYIVVVFIVHSIVTVCVCAMTAGAFLVVGRRLYAECVQMPALVAFRPQLDKLQVLSVGASTLLIVSVVAIAALASVGYAIDGSIENPRYYIAQQFIYRGLQFVYCAFVMVVLREPPEVASRVDFVRLDG